MGEVVGARQQGSLRQDADMECKSTEEAGNNSNLSL